MPLNTTTYMVSHGWGGAGLPLDGAGGRGLKKPLAIPQRRGLKGLGKDRDRAVEWWDCLFEAGAKSLAIADPTNSNKPWDFSTHLRSPMAGSTTIPTNKSSSQLAPSPAVSSRLSLIASAKREHAKRSLMSNFVRGRAHEQLAEETRKAEEELAKKVAEQDKLRKAVQAKLESGTEPQGKEAGVSTEEGKKRKREAKTPSSDLSPFTSVLPPAADEVSLPESKAARKLAKQAKCEADASNAARKAEKRAQKEAKKALKTASSEEEGERKSKRSKRSSADGADETKEQRRLRKAAERQAKQAKKLAKTARKSKA